MEIEIHSMHEHRELQERTEEMEKRWGKRGLRVFTCRYSLIWGGEAHANSEK